MPLIDPIEVSWLTGEEPESAVVVGGRHLWNPRVNAQTQEPGPSAERGPGIDFRSSGPNAATGVDDHERQVRYPRRR